MSEETRQPSQAANPVQAVYELREAAVEHGKALAQTAAASTAENRDQLLATQIALEEKTAAAIDECTERGEDVADAPR